MGLWLQDAEPKRLERAFDLIQQQHVRRVKPGVWSVESQTWPGCYYVVRDGHCACPDSTRRGVTCKHALAATLAAALRPGLVSGRIELDGEPPAF